MSDLIDQDAHLVPGDGVWSKRLMDIRLHAEEIGHDLAHDQDWIPVCFVDGTVPTEGPLPPGIPDSQRGKETTIILAFGGDMFGHTQGKDTSAALIKIMAILFQATRLIFLSTAWMSMVPQPKDGPPGETEEEKHKRHQEEFEKWWARVGTPSQDPNRIERLFILSVAYGGEDDGIKFAHGDIIRSPDKGPRLANWSMVDSGDSRHSGRFADNMYEGLEIAHCMRDGGIPCDKCGVKKPPTEWAIPPHKVDDKIIMVCTTCAPIPTEDTEEGEEWKGGGE